MAQQAGFGFEFISTIVPEAITPMYYCLCPMPNLDWVALYHVALIKSRGSSLVVTHRTADIRVISDRPVTLGPVPVELSTSISGIHAATYVVNACVS